jgi:hypothetical protein
MKILLKEVFMEKINQLIIWCEENSTRKEYVSIKARLKMINVLCEELSSFEDSRFVEEIIDAFSEIIGIQQEIIDDMKKEIECYSNNVQEKVETEEEKKAREKAREKENLKRDNPYIPTGGEFRNEKQIVTCFLNYLRFHTAKELSKFTAYDYCSRVKNIAKKIIGEDGGLLYTYNNIDKAFGYIEKSFYDLRVNNVDKNKPEFKAIANASAALNKFIEFKDMVGRNR